jgi:hypothetical protein
MGGEDGGDRELDPEGGGNHIVQLTCMQGDDWHLPLQGDCGKGNLASMAELPMLSS